MIKTYKIDAVHPVLKRVVKSGLTEVNAKALYTELVHNKYEAIQYEVDKIIYEVGDDLCITKEMYDDEFNNIKEEIDFILGEYLTFPIKAKIVQKRINNKYGQLFIRWDSLPETNYLKESNIYLLEKLGFGFTESDIGPIPIKDSEDEYLHENDLILKYMMLRNDLTEEEARKYLEVVFKAMDETGIVFYRP